MPVTDLTPAEAHLLRAVDALKQIRVECSGLNADGRVKRIAEIVDAVLKKDSAT